MPTLSGRNTPEPATSKNELSLIVPLIPDIEVNDNQPVDPSRIRTRSNSPARLSTELTLKYQTQLNRINTIGKIFNAIPEDGVEASLSDVQEDITQLEARLHYLRSCMEGAPSQLIANFPLVGSSLQPSWEMLAERFENKRLLIQAQLDKLCQLKPLTSKSARGLTSLITTVTEANKALNSLGVTDLGDHMLTYHVSRHLDRSTREAWENSLGSSNEYPRFTQLESFVNSRARALECIESSTPSTQPSTQGPRKSVTAHQASASGTTQPRDQSQHSSQFYCDCCDVNHFVVVCPKFRELDAPARRKLAENQRLCYNCLGGHNVHSCKSTKGCKHCSARHHTMLHLDNKRTTQPGQPHSTEPKPSTPSTPH